MATTVAVAAMIGRRYQPGQRSPDAILRRRYPVPMAEPGTQRTSLAGRYLAALSFRDCRWVSLAAFSGSSAHWALIVARGVLVHDLTGSSALVGVATFAAMAHYQKLVTYLKV